MIKAVIFDFFGVLYVDSHASLAQKFSHKAAEITDLGRQSDYGWLSKEQYLQQLSQVTGESPGSIESFIDSEHHLNVDLVATVEKLKATYKIGLLSNVGRGWIEEFMHEHEIGRLFDAVIASGDVGITKPNPEIFELMAERLGENPGDCLMIDDIADNCGGADAAGMKAIHYIDNTQLRQELQALLTS